MHQIFGEYCRDHMHAAEANARDCRKSFATLPDQTTEYALAIRRLAELHDAVAAMWRGAMKEPSANPMRRSKIDDLF